MVYRRRPKNFKSRFDVVSCYCEYKGKILIMKRSEDKVQGGTWDKPAGKVSADESLKRATLREIREETGIELKLKDLNGHRKVYVRYADYDYVFHMFRAIFQDEVSVQLNDEHSEYKWVTPRQAVKMKMIQDEDTCIKLFYGIKSAL